MSVSTITDVTKQVTKVYAARDYNADRPRVDRFIEINIPEYAPTIPKDDKYEMVSISGSYFYNSNYPITSGAIKMAHCLKLPLLRGTTCPIYFEKGTPFLLFTPTTKLEEGFLLYI